MPYRYLLPPETFLPLPIGRGNSIVVSPTLYGFIRDNLPDSDWTVLSIDSDSGVEIVRVEGIIYPDKLVVLRGRDGTVPLAFPAGAAVKYSPTVEAILASVDTSVRIRANGVISHYRGVLNVPELEIQGIGGALSGGIFTVRLAGCGECEPAPVIPESLKPYRIVADGSIRITDDGSYRAYA